jgi:hypothetical protein
LTIFAEWALPKQLWIAIVQVSKEDNAHGRTAERRISDGEV